MKKILFMLILLIPFFVYAECDSKVTISKLEFSEKKGYAEELEQSSYECNNIKLNIKMYNKDDSIIYNLTIKNNSDDDVELNNVIDSKSEYIVYKIEDKDLIVEKGKEKTFKLSATYTKPADPVLLVNGTIEDNQVMNLSVTTVVPDTVDNPNTNATMNYIITIACIAFVIIVGIWINIRKKNNIGNIFVFIGIISILTPVIVYALTNFELKIDAKVVIGEPKEKAIEPEPQVTYVCKKATTLHTKECTATKNGCFEAGYVEGNKGTTITYGTIPSNTPKAGDAYDCDVNNDGIYDAETERFYYVVQDNDKVVLIHSLNINDQTGYKYDAEGNSSDNTYGPRTAYTYLPSVEEWSNPNLVLPGTRNIDTKDNTNWTNQGTMKPFTYTNKAARLLTYHEIQVACGDNISTTRGTLDSCNFLLENIGKYESGTGLDGYYLETPETLYLVSVDGILRTIWTALVNEYNPSDGIRPVITIRPNYLEGNIKKFNNEIIYPEGKTKETVVVGDTVTIGKEQFNVVKHVGNDLVLLAKYNLKVGIMTNYSTGEKTGEYTNNDSWYGYQSSFAKGYYYGSGTYAGIVHFSNSNYWSNKNINYPVELYDLYGNESNIKAYLDRYVELLGVNVKEARLLKYDEAIELGCDISTNKCNRAKSFVRNTSYWLNTAYSNDKIYFIKSDGTFNNALYNDENFGIRPVIVI